MFIKVDYNVPRKTLVPVNGWMIRGIRLHLGLSQRKFAKYVGVQYNAIQRIEKFSRPMDLNKVVKPLAKSLGLSVEDITLPADKVVLKGQPSPDTLAEREQHVEQHNLNRNIINGLSDKLKITTKGKEDYRKKAEEYKAAGEHAVVQLGAAEAKILELEEELETLTKKSTKLRLDHISLSQAVDTFKSYNVFKRIWKAIKGDI